MDIANLMLFHDALKKFNETITSIGGCEDGKCLIIKPKPHEIFSIRGNCCCWNDKIKMQRYMHAVDRFRERIEIVAENTPVPLKPLKGITKEQPPRRKTRNKYE